MGQTSDIGRGWPPATPDLPPYLKEREVSEITGLALSTLRNWRHQGRGPAYVKAGRAIRYPRETVLTYMENRMVVPGGDAA